MAGVPGQGASGELWSHCVSWADLTVPVETNHGAARLDLGEEWPDRWSVSWRAGQRAESRSVRELARMPLAGADPIRVFSWRRGQRHRPGLAVPGQHGSASRVREPGRGQDPAGSGFRREPRRRGVPAAAAPVRGRREAAGAHSRFPGGDAVGCLADRRPARATDQGAGRRVVRRGGRARPGVRMAVYGRRTVAGERLDGRGHDVIAAAAAVGSAGAEAGASGRSCWRADVRRAGRGHPVPAGGPCSAAAPFVAPEARHRHVPAAGRQLGRPAGRPA